MLNTCSPSSQFFLSVCKPCAQQSWRGLKVVKCVTVGRSVVTTKEFKCGEIVCDYYGEQMSVKEFHKKSEKDCFIEGRYCLEIRNDSQSFIVNAYKEDGISFGRLINHCNRHSNLTWTVKTTSSCRHILFRAKKKIPIGSHLFYNYGGIYKYPDVLHCPCSRMEAEFKCAGEDVKYEVDAKISNEKRECQMQPASFDTEVNTEIHEPVHWKSSVKSVEVSPDYSDSRVIETAELKNRREKWLADEKLNLLLNLDKKQNNFDTDGAHDEIKQIITDQLWQFKMFKLHCFLQESESKFCKNVEKLEMRNWAVAVVFLVAFNDDLLIIEQLTRERIEKYKSLFVKYTADYISEIILWLCIMSRICSPHTARALIPCFNNINVLASAEFADYLSTLKKVPVKLHDLVGNVLASILHWRDNFDSSISSMEISFAEMETEVQEEVETKSTVSMELELEIDAEVLAKKETESICSLEFSAEETNSKVRKTDLKVPRETKAKPECTAVPKCRKKASVLKKQTRHLSTWANKTLMANKLSRILQSDLYNVYTADCCSLSIEPFSRISFIRQLPYFCPGILVIRGSNDICSFTGIELRNLV